jgi:hypothetical protein
MFDYFRIMFFPRLRRLMCGSGYALPKTLGFLLGLCPDSLALQRTIEVEALRIATRSRTAVAQPKNKSASFSDRTSGGTAAQELRFNNCPGRQFVHRASFTPQRD